MQKSTKARLKSPSLDAPLISGSDGESLNPTSLETSSKVNSPVENSKQCFHGGSGYDNRKVGSISLKHNVFVLGIDGKPLTPTTNAKARKLMEGKQAEPIWNKFWQFGIQMLVEVGNVTPKTSLGVDFGTKFEGYVVAVGKENNLSVMWKLPNKKKLVNKLEERRTLRRARRFRNCRRREARFDNREKKQFIAPSQLQIVNSRLKCISEMFNCYPIDAIALEDVKFNHSDKRWGRNFSTVEIGKKRIFDWIKRRAYLQLFIGYDTETLREEYGYHKSGRKNVEIFNSHCSDALALATEIYAQQHIEAGTFLVVDDTYRPVRRRLHDTQPSKGSIRAKYSAGNFRGIRKGTICNFGQVCGGIKEKIIRTYNWDNKRLSKNYNKIDWLSHNFKTKGVDKANSPPR